MKLEETVDHAIDILRRWEEGETHFSLTTSGSTGEPSEIKHSRSALQWSAESTLNTWFQTSHSLPNDGVIPPIQLCILPLNKAGGFMQLIRSAVWQSPIWISAASASPFQFPVNAQNEAPWVLLLNGQALPFSLERWEKYPPQLLSITPMQLQLAIGEKTGKQILKSMHTVLIGGQALSQDLENQLLSDFPNTRWIHTFGSTETASHFAGRILNGSNAEYTLTMGSSLTTTESGEIQISNPATNHRKITLHDKIHQTSPNTFIWLGRTNLYVNSGGVKIPIESLEKDISAILHWPLYSFYLAGKPHPVLGEELTLFTTHTHPEPNTIHQQLSELPKLHQPKTIVLIPTVHLSENGKILRKINP